MSQLSAEPPAPQNKCWFSIYLCTNPRRFVCRDQSGFPVRSQAVAELCKPPCLNRASLNTAKIKITGALGCRDTQEPFVGSEGRFRGGTSPDQSFPSPCFPLKAQGSAPGMSGGFQLRGRVGILRLTLEQLLAAGDESQHLPLVLLQGSRAPAAQRDLPEPFLIPSPGNKLRSTGN